MPLLNTWNYGLNIHNIKSHNKAFNLTPKAALRSALGAN